VTLPYQCVVNGEGRDPVRLARESFELAATKK
jgi:hypothetical protein